MSDIITAPSSSPFAYPWRYAPEADRELCHHMEPAWVGAAGEKAFTPADALVRWSKSDYGRWQAGQTARYPTFHALLDERFVPAEVDPDTFRLGTLRLMASAALYQSDVRAGKDFHPVGHMANVALVQDELLFDGPLGDVIDSPELLRTVRHAMALHDIAETEAPVIASHFGFHVGDVPASRPKTPDERQQETKIFSFLLEELYGDVYGQSTRDDMVALVSHAALDDRALAPSHMVTEIAHHMNSARTALAMGTAALAVSLHDPMMEPHADVLSLLSEQGTRLIEKKLAALKHHIPPSHPINYVVELTMRQLNAVVHARDGDEDWMSRRRLVSDEYGEYKAA